MDKNKAEFSALSFMLSCGIWSVPHANEWLDSRIIVVMQPETDIV